MSNKNLISKKDNPNLRLEDRIFQLLKEKGALPVCAIKGILEEKLDKRINRRRIYRKVNKMRKWERVRKVTEKPISYFKVIKR